MPQDLLKETAAGLSLGVLRVVATIAPAPLYFLVGGQLNLWNPGWMLLYLAVAAGVVFLLSRQFTDLATGCIAGCGGLAVMFIGFNGPGWSATIVVALVCATLLNRWVLEVLAS